METGMMSVTNAIAGTKKEKPILKASSRFERVRLFHYEIHVTINPMERIKIKKISRLTGQETQFFHPVYCCIGISLFTSCTS